MKYQILTEDTIEIITGIKYRQFPPFLGKTDNKIIKDNIITTKILTDGEIIQLEPSDNEQNIIKIPEYQINGKIYPIDVIKKDKIKLINANYCLKVTCVKEFIRGKFGGGLFEVIKNIEIYLKNKKDKTALKNIKKTLNLISQPRNYNQSIYSYLLGNYTTKQDFEYEKQEPNIYKLKKY